VIVIVVIAVVALAALAGLVVTPIRRRGQRSLTGAPPAPHVSPAPLVSPPPPASPPAGSPPPLVDTAPDGAQPDGAHVVEAAALDTPADVTNPPEAATGTVLEIPDPTAGRLIRLRGRLARSQSTLGRGLLTALSRDRLDDDAWEEIEDTLLTADMGVAATQEVVSALRERVRVLGVRTPDQLRNLLRDELLAQVGTTTDRSLNTAPHDGRPAVVLVVGVNGTGKTTTCGKLARVLVADGNTVLLGAADTFRAAAADQLQTWGERVGARTVRGPEGGDPASIAFDAVKDGIAAGVDTVLIDTAGRLHTKSGLMDELGKVKRVVEKQAVIDETLLVLDATTGQNGVIQAKVFTEAVAVTGIVLTKLDGTAKGGIVVAVQRELGIPVKLVGLGEGPDDLAPFEAEAFVDALLG
jgi:fused signal recognition particle receptor